MRRRERSNSKQFRIPPPISDEFIIIIPPLPPPALQKIWPLKIEMTELKKATCVHAKMVFTRYPDFLDFFFFYFRKKKTGVLLMILISNPFDRAGWLALPSPTPRRQLSHTYIHTPSPFLRGLLESGGSIRGGWAKTCVSRGVGWINSGIPACS